MAITGAALHFWLLAMTDLKFTHKRKTILIINAEATFYKQPFATRKFPSCVRRDRAMRNSNGFGCREDRVFIFHEGDYKLS